MPKPTFQWGAPHQYLMDFQKSYPQGGAINMPWDKKYESTGQDVEMIMELLRRMLGKDKRYGDFLSQLESNYAKGTQVQGYDPANTFVPSGLMRGKE